MKAFLKFLFFILFFILIIVIAGLFLPKTNKINVHKQIDAPSEIVFEQVNDLSKWEQWSPWITSDTSMHFTLAAKKKGEGAGFNWESIKYGNCKGILTHSQINESVGISFDFKENSKTTALFYIEPIGDGCIVNWTLSFSNLEFWERYFIILYKKKITNLLKEGLISLKTNSEDLKYSRIGQIEIIDIAESIAVIKVDTVDIFNEQEKLENLDKYLNYFFQRRKLSPAGEPFKLCYGSINDTLSKIGYGYPLQEDTWIWKTLEKHRFNPSKAVSVSHFGGVRTAKAHEAIVKYMAKENIQFSGVAWEVRKFNINTDKDSSLWETKIYYPIGD